MAMFGRKNKKKHCVCIFGCGEGLKNIPRGAAIIVEQDDEEGQLIIKQRLSQKLPLFLKYSQICAFKIVSEREVTQESKSVLGRAMIGGLFLGPLGGVVGGMSGIGNKTKSVGKNYFVINYHPQGKEDEIDAIYFEIGPDWRWSKFIKELKPKTNVVESQNL